MIHPHRALRTLWPLLTAVLAVALLLAPTAGAHAVANRYWGYYQLTDGAWTFASTGPDQATPADGSVEGWRYAVATMETPRPPRAVPTFDQICAGTAAVTGSKRVGVVIDYGRDADAGNSGGSATPPAPRSACAVVPSAATGADVLAAVAKPRTEKGLVCGLDGYPSAGCFEELATPPPAAAAPDDRVTLASTGDAAAGSSAAATPTDEAATADQGVRASVWVLVGLLVLAAVAAVALSLARRRRTADPTR